MSKINSLALLLSCFIVVNNLILDSTNVTITLDRLYEKYTGKKGTIAIESFSKFDIIDTTRNIYFKSKISNEKNITYEVDCGFWRANDSQLYVFCNIGENIPSGNYSLNFKETPEIKYADYIITLNQRETLEFEKYDIYMIDLYSDEQTLYVEKDKDIYELKFKLYSYGNELITFNYLSFPDCSHEKEELICKISKKQLEAMLLDKESKIAVTYVNYMRGQNAFPLIPYINVKFNYIQKIDVYIGITKLIENIVEQDTFVTYETNVTNINNVLIFMPSLELEFMNNIIGTIKSGCTLRKYDNTPLLLICFINRGGINWLKEITEEKVFNNLNVKYNFRIQPVKNEEKIYCQLQNGAFLFWSYPEILDFTKSDSLIIEFGMENPSYLDGFSFNENATDLSCQTMGRDVRRCIVPKSHFVGLTSGYYFIKHQNHLGGKSTNYEAPPFKVILNDSPSDGSADYFKGDLLSFILYHWLFLIFILF